MKKYEYLEIDYTAKGVVFLCTDKHKEWCGIKKVDSLFSRIP